MTDSLPEATAERPASALPVPAAAFGACRSARIQFVLCLTVTVALLTYLLWTPASRSSAAGGGLSSEVSPVRVTPSSHIHVRSDSPLHQKLQVTTVKPAKIAVAMLTVTGTVVASLRPDKGKGTFWQFSSPELLTTYTDWQRAIADIAFASRQLESIRQLADSRVSSQGTLVKRLRKLVEAGTDTEKDLAAARTELLQAQIQGRKDTHEAETALRLARRTEAALARQLQQAGVEPDLLRLAASELDVVVADVPEALMSRVRHGQGCEARFFGIANRHFSGKVRAISPVLSKERRSLRVLFSIDDPDDLLRPGMFADIGLGTDSREALLVPLAGVVHVGRSDYMLVRDGAAGWRVTLVQVGEVSGGEAAAAVEILDGLQSGDQVISRGAILLKPVIVEALQQADSQGAGGA